MSSPIAQSISYHGRPLNLGPSNLVHVSQINGRKTVIPDEATINLNILFCLLFINLV